MSQPSSSPPSYSRQTIICAADMLKALGHSGFSRFLMEIDLPDPNIGRGSGLMARAISLAEFAIKNPQFLTPERRTLASEIIQRAIQVWNGGPDHNLGSGERERFAAAMQREGLAARLAEGSDESVTLGGETHSDGWTDASITLSGPDLEKLRGAMMGQRPHSASHPEKVFVVHGHDEAVRETVARFIEKFGFKAIILHEQPNKGRTIITKFREEAADVGFAVVLMTPDDVGKAKDATELRPRARQNVVAELFFFIGKLGPDRVAALVKGDIEPPSDFDGVVYISLDNSNWRMELARELEAAGYEVDWNKAMRP